MEVNEGQVRITTSPFVTIADTPLAECTTPEIAKEIMSLCKRIEDQRNTIISLRKQLAQEAV
jgi:ABC-type ATPase involved in cell division